MKGLKSCLSVLGVLAYIVSAALTFFGMSAVEDLPSKNTFPANIRQDTLENKKKAFDEIFGRLMVSFFSKKMLVQMSMMIL